MNHSPAEIRARSIIDAGVASDPASDKEVLDDWPAFIGTMMESPDNQIATYNTQGLTQGRDMRGGRMSTFPGIQFKVRGSDYGDGYRKAEAIVEHLDGIKREELYITEDGTNYFYVIHSVIRVGDILDIGADPSGRRRNQFTINAVVRIESLN
jgi:hypothetical protein